MSNLFKTITFGPFSLKMLKTNITNANRVFNPNLSSYLIPFGDEDLEEGNVLSIQHNLANKFCYVVVYNEADQVENPSGYVVNLIDENSLTITFNTPPSEAVTYHVLVVG